MRCKSIKLETNSLAHPSLLLTCWSNMQLSLATFLSWLWTSRGRINGYKCFCLHRCTSQSYNQPDQCSDETEIRDETECSASYLQTKHMIKDIKALSVYTVFVINYKVLSVSFNVRASRILPMKFRATLSLINGVLYSTTTKIVISLHGQRYDFSTTL